MYEIRFHGRGGQGAVIGSEILAQAFFLEGKYVQAFPAFGVERRGAPVTAFCRVDDRPILLRNQIYEPDAVVVLDPTLLVNTPVTQGLKKGGIVLINGSEPPEHYARLIGPDFRTFVVNAGAVAAAHGLGSAANPIVNTAILGALARVAGQVGLEAVARAILKYAPVKKEANSRAAREAHDKVVPAGGAPSPLED
ncbi:MAG: 2-oxoacid:acceptor oxidoreductase family protein [Pseudomonadota bacterium]